MILYEYTPVIFSFMDPDVNIIFDEILSKLYTCDKIIYLTYPHQNAVVMYWYYTRGILPLSVKTHTSITSGVWECDDML